MAAVVGLEPTPYTSEVKVVGKDRGGVVDECHRNPKSFIANDTRYGSIGMSMALIPYGCAEHRNNRFMGWDGVNGFNRLGG